MPLNLVNEKNNQNRPEITIKALVIDQYNENEELRLYLTNSDQNGRPSSTNY
jgi:hypothetical protein